MRLSTLDFKLGLRMLRRYPAFSVIGGLALSLAIAVGAIAFELVGTQLNPSLPLPDGDRIVRLENWNRAQSALEPHALYDFDVWKRELHSVQQLGAARSIERNLILPDVPPRPVQVAEMSPSAFSLTGVPPLMGRSLVESDANAGAPDVVVLGEDIWRGPLASDPNILGRTIQLGDTKATVVGVMPKAFGFPRFQRAWLPLRVTANQPGGGPPVLVFGRLAPDATLESARAELEVVGARLAAADSAYRENLQPRVAHFASTSSQGIPIPVIAMFIGVFLLLGGVSMNVATLMFARTALRESEIVVRIAIGATRARVILQLLAESLVLAGFALVTGLLIAAGILRIVWYQTVVVRQTLQPFWRQWSLEPITVLWAVGLALVGTVLVGLVPAIKATGAQVQGALARSNAGVSGLKFGGVWSFVIAAQVAFTVLCMPVAVGVTGEAIRDYRARSAFPTQDYLTFQVAFDGEREGEARSDAERARMEFATAELERRLLTDPSVTAVTIGTGIPGAGGSAALLEAQRGAETPFLVLGSQDDYVSALHVNLGFFDVFGLPIVAGRNFERADLGAGTVVVNQSLAAKLGANPIGMHVRNAAPRLDGGIPVGEPGPWHEVVGVVRNTGVSPTDRGEADYVYYAAAPSELYPGYVAARVRGSSNLAARIPAIALNVDPALRVHDVVKLDELVRRGDLAGVLGSIGAIVVVTLAILLSAAGLFALMSVAVARRTREIGIRVALGADSRWVLRSVFSRAAAQLGVGIAIGDLLMVAIRRLGGNVGVANVLLPVAGVSALMALVGVAACVGPAKRALRVQATEAIKGV